MPKRTIFRVLPLTEGGRLKGWKITDSSWSTLPPEKMAEYARASTFPSGQGVTKRRVVELAITFAKRCQPSQLIVCGRDGRIQEERTYPRESDPRRSKG